MVISMATGAIGAAFPALNWLGERLVDVGSGVLTRGMYAFLNPDMSADEKSAYVFDLKQMEVDFLTGAAMHFASKGIAKLKANRDNVSGNGVISGEFSDPTNDAMIARLEQALKNGDTITGADASFYMHELAKTTLMNGGKNYQAAHLEALKKYGVSPFSVYHPDVIKKFPSQFNSLWKNFWDIE